MGGYSEEPAQTAKLVTAKNRHEPVSVAADGRPIWSPVDVVEAAATAKLVAAPKIDEHVYQVVALKNPAAYALLQAHYRL